MMDFISSLPLFWIILAVTILVCGGLGFYALRSKGDVLLEASHGNSSFRLQAKERPSVKKSK
jgi:hypothetical protein